MNDSIANYSFEDAVIEDPVTHFLLLQNQIKEYSALNKGDRNAPMPQYKNAVQRLINFFEKDDKLLKLVADDRKKQQENIEADDKGEAIPHPTSSGAFALAYDHSVNLLYSCTLDFKISQDAKEKEYPHKPPVEGRYPYLTVLDALYHASAFIDSYQRSIMNGLTPVYHSDRYAHYGLAFKHKVDDMVLVPTFRHLSLLDLIKLRAAPVMVIGIGTDVAFADAYFQTSKDFWDHDSNHNRRFDTFNQICMERKLEERCKTDKALSYALEERASCASKLVELTRAGEDIAKKWAEGRATQHNTTQHNIDLSKTYEPSMTANNASRRKVREKVEVLNIVINQALSDIREETYREFQVNIKEKILPGINLDGVTDSSDLNLRKMKRTLYFELLHEFALPPTKDAIIDAFNFSRKELGNGPFEIMRPAGEDPNKVAAEVSSLRISKTNNLLSGLNHLRGLFSSSPTDSVKEIDVHYIFDPELAPNFITTLHNKLGTSFYDNMFKRDANTNPPFEARTPELIAEAALSILDDFGIKRHEVDLPENDSAAKIILANLAIGEGTKKEIYLDKILRKPNLLGEGQTFVQRLAAQGKDNSTLRE